MASLSFDCTLPSSSSIVFRTISWTCSLVISCCTSTALLANKHVMGSHYQHVKGIAEPVERHGTLQTLICAPVVRPKRCPTSSNPALLPSWTVVCPSFTLLMMLLLPGWPTMGLNRICKKKITSTTKCYNKLAAILQPFPVLLTRTNYRDHSFSVNGPTGSNSLPHDLWSTACHMTCGQQPATWPVVNSLPHDLYHSTASGGDWKHFCFTPTRLFHTTHICGFQKFGLYKWHYYYYYNLG